MRLPGRRADGRYHDLLDRAAGNAVQAAELLAELIRGFPERAGLARDILLREQEGDRLTHDLIHELSSGARPPFARSDLHALATALDDVVDIIEQVADLFGLYRIEAPMDPAVELADVLTSACRTLAAAVAALRRGEPVATHLAELHRLENEGDRVSRDAVAALFTGGVDPMVVIRWKDIFEQLEQAIDACEAAAHVLEGVALTRG